MASEKTYRIGNRRELFLDDFLTSTVSGDVALRQHFPQAMPVSATQPTGYYMTMLQEDGLVRCYYRGLKPGYTGELVDGHPGEYTGYAESPDGIVWTMPELNLFPNAPANAIWDGTKETHNFCPFIDRNPACRDGERYKAVAGIVQGGGLFRFFSADGIHWRKYEDKPFLTLPDGQYGLDSQNVCFWSESEQCYVLFFRLWINQDGRVSTSLDWGAIRRGVARVTSPDFVHWSEPRVLELNRPGEHLYVSQLAPYARAPHIYIGTPTRFFEERGAATDLSFFHVRNGMEAIRTFPGAWITPGLDPERWGNRSNYLAYNIVQTSPTELSLYHIRSRVQYILRLDGFASLHADVAGGEWLSRPLEYQGGQLEINLGTAAGGAFQAGLLKEDGTALPGFGVDDCELFFGDVLDYAPRWRGGNLPLQPGDVFRLRFRMTECDVYSFAFK